MQTSTIWWAVSWLRTTLSMVSFDLSVMTQSLFPAVNRSLSKRECFAVLWHLTFAHICSGPSAAKSTDIIDFCVTCKLCFWSFRHPSEKISSFTLSRHVKWLLNSVALCSFMFGSAPTPLTVLFGISEGKVKRKQLCRLIKLLSNSSFISLLVWFSNVHWTSL